MTVNPLSHPIEPFDELLDWETPSEGGIELSPAHLQQGIQLSQTVTHPHQQWQIYLHGLALSGLKEWLAEWAADLEVSDHACSILHPPVATLVDAACNVQVQSLTLCLIATGYVTGPTVLVPRAAMECPHLVPHIYVLVEVLEDQMQVRPHGYLRRDRLQRHQQTQPYRLTSEWTVSLPLSWFDANLASLLVDLRCLQAEAIASPESAVEAPLSLSQLQARLAERLPQLLSPECVWQEVLTWQEGMSLLSHPDVLTRLYEAQQAVRQGQEVATAIASVIPHAPLPVTPRPMTQRAINVATWLGDRLDQLAQDLSWTLMPAFASDAALRSVDQDLEQWGIHIPPEAKGAYQDIQLGGATLRIHVITWPLPNAPKAPGWTLMVILGAQPETELPAGIQLQIRDETRVLVEQTLDSAIQDGYLYAQVGGHWHEQFVVTVTLEDGVMLTLPPFTYTPHTVSAA